MTGSQPCRNTLTCNCPQCNVKHETFNRDVPAPRLVCVELNPGPKMSMRQLQPAIKAAAAEVGLQAASQAAFALGQATAKSSKAHKAKKTKQGPTGVPRLPSNPPRGNLTPLNLRVNAPVSKGRLLQTGVPSADVRVPFVTNGLGVYNTGNPNGPLAIGLGAGTATTVFTLCPQANKLYNASGDSVICDYAFGTAVRDLGSLYKEYRITKLRATFIPLLPTSQAGMITLSFSPDPNTKAPNNLDRASAYANNFSTVVWQEASIDLKNIVGANSTEYKYYMPSALNDQGGGFRDASGRLTTLGCVVGWGSGVNLTAGSLLGFLRMEGEIELMNLCPFEDKIQATEQKSNDDVRMVTFNNGNPVLYRQDAVSFPSSVNSMTPSSGIATPNVITSYPPPR